MAKYITLDGLSTFLGKLKDGSYRATDVNFGGIKVVGNRASSILTVDTSTTEDRYYGIELDQNGKAFVNIPWTDTTYIVGTGLTSSQGTNNFQVNYDSNTLFAGEDAKDNSSSISNSYSGHSLQLGKDHGWKNDGGNLSNLNNFIEYGIYNIFGEHTRNDDNLPIMNTGSGHTFQGRLLVYDSSLSNTGNAGDDCCITQVLTLSNRVGGDGNTYIRTATGRTKSELTWETWGKLQTNVEVGQIPETNLTNLVDNGIYSGVITYSDGSLLTTSSDRAITFVLITVNGYAAAAQLKVPAQCTQLLYGISVGGAIIIKKRKGIKSTSDFSFNVWEDLGGGLIEIPTASDSTLGGIKVVGNRTSPITTVGTSDTSDRYYGVELNSDGKAFVNVPWTISTATTTAFGGIKLAVNPRGSSIPTAQISTGGTTAGRYYGVELDSDGKAFVNVPWSDTQYTLPTASSSTLGGIKVTGNTLGSSVAINDPSSTAGQYYPIQITNDKRAVVNVPWNTPVTTPDDTAITLYQNQMTLVTPDASATELTISAFASPTSGVVNNYGLTIQNIPSSSYTITYPSNTIKWANGIEPFFTGGETLEIIFTTIDNGTTYTATWTKYF